MIELEAYGNLGSIKSLQEAIKKRRHEGKELAGEGVIYQGADIIKENGQEYIKDPDRNYPRFEARVYPNGNYRLVFEPEHDFGELPGGWQEIVNP